ncbi:DSS1/SEM1 family-domain-containing protein [Paraphysoderma sedebokerense]|nr:DSS1/SEM1 family-domain-containing protein [Paraphysoderma sedebokerense]
MSSSSASAAAATKKNDEKPAPSQQPDAVPQLGSLEEDDEFEDFPAEDWNETQEDKEDVHAWEENWDEDEVDDDFSNQLRAELQKRLSGPQPMSM